MSYVASGFSRKLQYDLSTLLWSQRVAAFIWTAAFVGLIDPIAADHFSAVLSSLWMIVFVASIVALGSRVSLADEQLRSLLFPVSPRPPPTAIL